jgi:putative nucleotidyltransferase with HDIG domain
MAGVRLDRLSERVVAMLRAVHAVAPPGTVLVGGAVRDARLGRPILDIDLAMPRGALDVGRRVAARVGGTFVLLDEARGAARVVRPGVRLDLSDYRAPSLEGDLAARDFTVNALAVDLRSLIGSGRAAIIDPVGGLADLQSRRLRIPSVAVLQDDPLRVLRGVRLEGVLGFRLQPATVRAARAAAPGLAAVAAERIRDELLGILGLLESARAVRRADALGILAVILPEVEPMRVTAQPLPHRFPVLEHSLRALAGADIVAAHPLSFAPFSEELAGHLSQPLGGGVVRAQSLKLAALLHDVAKPETAGIVEGRLRFFGHDVIGARRARVIGERLRLPDRVIGLVERLVRHHLRPMHLGQTGALTRRARYRFFRDLGPDAQDLLVLALVDAAAVTGTDPRRVWPRAALLRDLLGGWAEELTRREGPPLVRGDDVMARYGLTAGPAIGRLLERVREAQATGLVGTREEALAYLDSCIDDP